MELIVPTHGANSEKALSQEREGALTARKTVKKTAFWLQK
jgi:hypothetical protein